MKISAQNLSQEECWSAYYSGLPEGIARGERVAKIVSFFGLKAESLYQAFKGPTPDTLAKILDNKDVSKGSLDKLENSLRDYFKLLKMPAPLYRAIISWVIDGKKVKLAESQHQESQNPPAEELGASLRQAAQEAARKFELLLLRVPEERAAEFTEHQLLQLPAVTRAMEKGAEDACADYGGSVDECIQSMLARRLESLKSFIRMLNGRTESLQGLEPELGALCEDLSGLFDNLRKFAHRSPLLDQEFDTVRAAYPRSTELLQSVRKDLEHSQHLLNVAKEVYPALRGSPSLLDLDVHGKRFLRLFQEVTDKPEPWPEGGVWWPEDFDPINAIWDQLSIGEQTLANKLSVVTRQNVASKAIDYYKYELEWQRAEDMAGWYADRMEHD